MPRVIRPSLTVAPALTWLQGSRPETVFALVEGEAGAALPVLARDVHGPLRAVQGRVLGLAEPDGVAVGGGEGEPLALVLGGVASGGGARPRDFSKPAGVWAQAFSVNIASLSRAFAVDVGAGAEAVAAGAARGLAAVVDPYVCRVRRAMGGAVDGLVAAHAPPDAVMRSPPAPTEALPPSSAFSLPQAAASGASAATAATVRVMPRRLLPPVHADSTETGKIRFPLRPPVSAQQRQQG
ncbi:hypothetical protein STENM327S_01642 [Streptomyces tendae]